MSYPSSVHSFSTKNTNDFIQASHINDIQTEVVAIEEDLLSAWTDVTFSALNFTGGASQTWTVGASDQRGLSYRKIGKTMRVAFDIIETTVGGTPDASLQIAIPGGFTAAKAMTKVCYALDNGTRVMATVSVTASGTLLVLRRYDAANWSAATNATYVYGSIMFETTA